MGMLKAQFPDKIFLGCNAHAMDLFLKDLNKGKKKNGEPGPCPGVASVLSKAVMASNVINGSRAVGSALAEKQRAAGKI